MMEQNQQPVLHDDSGLSQNVEMGCQMQPVSHLQAIHCGNSPITTMTQVSPMMNIHEKQLSHSHMRASIGSAQKVDWNEEMSQQQNDAFAASNGSKTNLSKPSSLLQMEASDFKDLERGSGETPVAKKAIDRLITALRTSSPAALKSSVNLIRSVVSMDDLVALPEYNTFQNWMLSTKLGGSQPSTKMKCFFEITTSDSESSPLTDAWEVEANAEPGAKRLKTQNATGAVLDEIESTNAMLMDTIISITDDNRTDGITSTSGETLIMLSYTAASLAPDFKLLFAASGEPPIVMQTKLLVPGDYPSCSPVFVTDQRAEQPRNMFSDISGSADVAFQSMLRRTPEPRSIRETARVWDACVRQAVIEFAQQYGGGTFSSGWETSDSA